jgi:hypothetical protein
MMILGAGRLCIEHGGAARIFADPAESTDIAGLSGRPPQLAPGLLSLMQVNDDPVHRFAQAKGGLMREGSGARMRVRMRAC